jgi:site-specific DNA recombinase
MLTRSDSSWRPSPNSPLPSDPDSTQACHTRIPSTQQRLIDEQEAAERLLHEQLTNELQALDAREENLIELAADGDIAQLKIKAKLREIASQRRRLTERLATTTQNLSDSARLIEIALKLLENPQRLYRRCNDQQRRMLNQAIFHGLYVDDDNITDHSLHEPFARLHTVQQARQTAQDHEPPLGASTEQEHTYSAAPRSGDGRMPTDGVGILLAGVGLARCSSKPPRVEVPGIEPGSSVASSGLLRAQSAMPLLGSTGPADKPV